MTTVSIESNIDLNNLFNLNYNFDLLKGVIDALLKGQKATNQKLAFLEDQNMIKDKKLNELEKEIFYLKSDPSKQMSSNNLNKLTEKFPSSNNLGRTSEILSVEKNVTFNNPNDTDLTNINVNY